MPAGTVVKAVGHFDNSASNPLNPNNPPKPIRWGEKTTDEMFIAFLGVIKAKDFTPKTTSTQRSSGFGRITTSPDNNDSTRPKKSKVETPLEALSGELTEDLKRGR